MRINKQYKCNKVDKLFVLISTQFIKTLLNTEYNSTPDWKQVPNTCYILCDYGKNKYKNCSNICSKYFNANNNFKLWKKK